VSFARIVVPEVLDGLPADDPDAQRSRRDLHRVHRVMGSRGIVSRALRSLPSSLPLLPNARPMRILELGAGDGSLMLGVARSLQDEWGKVSLTLLDFHNLLSEATTASYAAVGWEVRAQVGDVLNWADGEGKSEAVDGLPHDAPHWDLIVANLFLHHFQTPQLSTILAAAAVRSQHFFACEPRRARLALVGSHLIGALGVNAVTREDAVLSVRAGFRDNELSQCWPANELGWTLSEYSAGLFSHCFIASRAREPNSESR